MAIRDLTPGEEKVLEAAHSFAKAAAALNGDHNLLTSMNYREALEKLPLVIADNLEPSRSTTIRTTSRWFTGPSGLHNDLEPK